jgi:putative ABC transport system substrate-binding protein
MKRRDFVTLIAMALPLRALAQDKRLPRVGLLLNGDPKRPLELLRARLKERGYDDGSTVRVEMRLGESQEQLEKFARELVALNVDVLVATQTPGVTALKNATQRIPIVMSSGDPLATGLVASLARPGGNITGFSTSTAQVGGKLMQLIRELLPAAKRGAVLANQTDPFTNVFVAHLAGPAKTAGLDLQVFRLKQTDDLAPAFAEMGKARAEFVIVQPSLRRSAAAALALKHRLPSFSPFSMFPSEGGLLSYSNNQQETYAAIADYIARVLKGARPADLPVQQASRFDLHINTKTARALGVALPVSLQAQADKLVD